MLIGHVGGEAQKNILSVLLWAPVSREIGCKSIILGSFGIYIISRLQTSFVLRGRVSIESAITIHKCNENVLNRAIQTNK